MSLTCQVQIILNNLSKDNVNFPEGLSLYVENIDNKLVFNFESKENMKKLIGTIDEVLEHVQVALKVIE